MQVMIVCAVLTCKCLDFLRQEYCRHMSWNALKLHSMIGSQDQELLLHMYPGYSTLLVLEGG